MADIFREVEEEVRRERLEKIWKEYGDYIIAVASLLIIAAAGYRLWVFYDARERASASNQYMLAEQMLTNGQSEGAAKAFGKVAQDAPGGYAKLAQLQEANALFAAGNNSDAVNLYNRLIADADPILSPVARIRLAWMTVDDKSRSEIQSLLAPLTDPGSAWRASATEVLAYADYRAGKLKQAIIEYKAIAGDSKAPTNVRQRSEAMATFIAAGGERDVGNVPIPPITSSEKAAPATDAGDEETPVPSPQNATVPRSKGAAAAPAAKATLQPAKPVQDTAHK